jgi:hypothetical protein
MSKASDLIQEIQLTRAKFHQDLSLANQELESPACYALPLIAFVLGLSLHKSVPNPSKVLLALATSPLFK